MHILIISISNFKNLLLTSPLISAIKLKYPEAVLHFVTGQAYRNYIEKVEKLDHVYTIEGDSVPLIFDLLKTDFKYIIDLEQSNRSLIIAQNLKSKYGTQVKVFSYPKGVLNKLLFSKWAYQQEALSTKFIKTCKALQLPINNLKLQYATIATDELGKDDIPTSHKLGYIVINLDNLTIPDVQIKDFCQHLTYPIIFTGKQVHFKKAQDYKNIDPFKIYNACGKYKEAEMYNIYSMSKAIVCANNIDLYLAAAAQKPILYAGKGSLSLIDIHPYTNYHTNFFKKLNNSLTVGDVLPFIK